MVSKIRHKKKTKQIDGGNLAQQIEDLKTEHGLSGYRMFPSPDNIVHLGISKDDDCVDVWMPWDIYREAAKRSAEHAAEAMPAERVGTT